MSLVPTLVNALWHRYGTALAILISGASIGVWIATLFDDGEAVPKSVPHPSPTMAELDRLVCPAGLIRRVQILGREDGFSRADGREAASVSDAGMRTGIVKGIRARTGQLDGTRDWDEMGYDRILLHQVEMAARVERGWLVARLKSEAGVANDTMGFMRGMPEGSEYPDYIEVAWPLAELESSATALPDRSSIYSKAFESDDLSYSFFGNPINLLSDVPADEAVVSLDIKIGDDTAADVAGLVTCEAPPEPMGVTFTSSKRWAERQGVYSFSCMTFGPRQDCSPRLGDVSCSETRPLACYKDGNRLRPDPPEGESALYPNYYLGGEVRFTQPVRGDSLSSYGEALGLCQSDFGQDWRPVDFHEAGGQIILVSAPLEDGINAWIDERDNGLTCWRPRRQ